MQRTFVFRKAVFPFHVKPLALEFSSCGVYRENSRTYMHPVTFWSVSKQFLTRVSANMAVAVDSPSCTYYHGRLYGECLLC